MIPKTIPLVLMAAAALAQTPDADRVFRFAHAGTPQSRQEITNAMRSIAELPTAALDNSAGILAVRGTAARLGLAEWLFAELDRPAVPQFSTAMHQYQIPGDSIPEVRTFWLVHAVQPQAMQEVVNAVRSIAEIQYVVAYSTNAVLVLRGSLDQVELAAWLIRQLDQPPAAQPDHTALEYRFADPRTPAVRVFHLAHTANPQAEQELVNAIRSIAEIQRVMVYTQTATICVRGSPAEASMAVWLVEELDREPAMSAAPADEYPAPANTSVVVRVFRLAPSSTPQSRQELVNLIRSTAGIQRAVVNSLPRSLTLRGTPGQLAAAERLIQEAGRAAI